MKKIFKKGYLYYTPAYPLCQQFLRQFTIISHLRCAVSNQSVRFAWDDLQKVKRSPEGADERFSKGIFMKKIFKKGYLYYTSVYPFCQ